MSHVATWNNIETLLRDAFAELPAAATAVEPPVSGPIVLSGTIRDFLEFLEHNELELAWDELESYGMRVHASGSFWRKLSEAANTMNLAEKAAAALKQVAG